MLLVASCYFYMYFIPIYILILAGTIVIDYFAGILIEQNHGKRRRFYLIVSLFANIMVLAVFKYYNFFIENIETLLTALGSTTRLPYLSILLPVGLSFHTFQAMSYTIEVYRGKQKAEKHFGIYALYVMFFPQLVAGPIERPQNVLHQFHELLPIGNKNPYIPEQFSELDKQSNRVLNRPLLLGTLKVGNYDNCVCLIKQLVRFYCEVFSLRKFQRIHHL